MYQIHPAVTDRLQRWLSLSASVLLLVAVEGTLPRSAQAQSDDQPIRLPGARAEIMAVNFTSIQAAIDALPAEGGVVRLPPGTFEISEPITIERGDVLIQGAGTSTHIVNQNADGKPALIVQHHDGAEVSNEDRLWRVMLSNFRVTGNPASGHGIVALRIQEIFVQGVTISEHGGDGIRLDHCYEDPRISDCLITYNNQTGLNLIGCHDIVVSANQFEENHDALHCIDGFNLCMTGNCLDDHLGHGVVIENTYGSVVSGNMIEECAGAALIMDRDCYGNTVSANVIAHNGAGVDLRDAHGCSISANTFTIMQSDALRIAENSGRITVTGNNFSNSYIGQQKVKRRQNDLQAGGLTLESTSDIAISGNVFSEVTPKAIELKGNPARRVVFANNVLTKVQSDHDQLVDSVVTDSVLPESD